MVYSIADPHRRIIIAYYYTDALKAPLHIEKKGREGTIYIIIKELIYPGGGSQKPSKGSSLLWFVSPGRDSFTTAIKFFFQIISSFGIIVIPTKNQLHISWTTKLHCRSIHYPTYRGKIWGKWKEGG